MKFNITGDKIRLINIVPAEIEKIVDFERLNRQYVNQYSKERHAALLNDKNYLYLSIRRLDNDSMIGHIILFGIGDLSRVLEFRRITINEKGSGYGREALRLGYR